MTDTKFFKMIGALEILIAWINFYVAFQAAQAGTALGVAAAALCVGVGVITTVFGAKMIGIIN